jgi:O-antigen ligase
MLVVGPIDLSFITGGFKALFPGLGGLDMNGIRLVGASSGFVAYIMFEPRARAAAVGRLGMVWVAFLAYACATLVMSLDPLEGARLFLKLAYPFLTFLIVIGLADSRERLAALTRYALSAAALYALVINPILAVNGGYRIDPDGFLRVGGLGSGDNPFAFYVVVILLMVFTRFLLRAQLRYLAFSVVLVGWIALTGTRIAVLASAAGFCVLGLLISITSQNRKIVVASVLATAGVTAVLLPNALARTFGFVPSPGELFGLLRDPVALYTSINWQGRQLLWAILWGAFAASPLLGLGLGSSSAVIRETFPDQGVKVAHNEYMRIATDTGTIGVVLLVAAVLTWLVAAVRLSLRGDRTVREYAFPAAASIVACAFVAATDNAIDYYSPFTQYIGFLVAGAVVAQMHRDTEGGEAVA